MNDYKNRVEFTGKRHVVVQLPLIRNTSVKPAFLYSCCFTMATFHQVQNLNINDLFLKLRKLCNNVNNYVRIRNLTSIAPDVERHIQSILSWANSWAEDEKANEKQKFEVGKLAEVGIVLEKCADSFETLSSEDPIQFMKGCLSIASSVDVLDGGPYGDASEAICGLLASILSASSRKEPDLVTLFTNKVHAELLKFNQELKPLRQTFEGLRSRAKNMNACLKQLKSVPNHVDLPDKVLYETDFPQFIGEVAHNFVEGLNLLSKKEEVKSCLMSMAIYCNAQTALFLLLTNILVTFQSTGRETKMVKILLDTQIQDAKEKLGFLSQEIYLRMSSVFTMHTYTGESLTEDDLRKIVTLRDFGQCRHLPTYDIIEGFREGLGMPTIQKTIVGLFKGIEGVTIGPKDIIHRYPQPQTKGDNHYFQLINHSHFPVKVRCGTAGSELNGLEFSQDVPPYSSYEHVATKSGWTFSAGGVFIMDLSGEVTSLENAPIMQNLKVFEFGLSNPPIGSCQLAILQKNPHLAFHSTGKDCWQRMNSNDSPPIYVEHCNKHYVVSGGYTDFQHYNDNHNFPGKNGCRTWRFVIQEYDPLKDLEADRSFFFSGSKAMDIWGHSQWENDVSRIMKSQ